MLTGVCRSPRVAGGQQVATVPRALRHEAQLALPLGSAELGGCTWAEEQHALGQAGWLLLAPLDPCLRWHRQRQHVVLRVRQQ